MTTALRYAGHAVFRYAGLDIRVVPIDNQPAFILGDICAVLGIDPVDVKVLVQPWCRLAMIKSETEQELFILAVDAVGLVSLVAHAEQFGTCVDAAAFKRWAFDGPITTTRQVRPSETGSVVEFQFPQSHADALVLADLMERDR